MEEIQDYYVFLGVPLNATVDDIKRAYARKRREYQNDETKSTQLNQAYEILCDSAKRKQYDIDMQFKNQIDIIQEKMRNSKTPEELIECFTEAKKIYSDILKIDSENIDALWNLVSIEKSLGNEEQAIEYLKQLEKYVDEDEKLQVYHSLGEIFIKQGKIKEAIKCLYIIYKADVTYSDDITTLARLFYEEEKNIKTAIQILNDCFDRSNETKFKVLYLCETLRAIRTLKTSSYQKIEESLYKKLESFHTNDVELNLKNAAAIIIYLTDAVDKKDFEHFHKLEKIYQIYNVNNAELNQVFESTRQIVTLIEKGKIHRAIDLYFEKEWTKEIKEELGRLINNEAEKIKESLECLKREAPAYWNMEKEFLELEKLIDNKLPVSKEFNALSKDRSISSYMRKIIECILLDGFVAFDDIKDELIEAKDSFFNKEDRGKLQHTLRKMEEYYPLCYERFTAIFFPGRSTDEILDNISQEEIISVQPLQTSRAEQNLDNESYSFIIWIIIIVIVIACPPSIFFIYVAAKWFTKFNEAENANQKELEIYSDEERTKEQK